MKIASAKPKLSMQKKLLQWAVKKLAPKCGLVPIPYELSLAWTKEASQSLAIASINDCQHPYKAGFYSGKAMQLNQMVQKVFDAAA